MTNERLTPQPDIPQIVIDLLGISHDTYTQGEILAEQWQSTIDLSSRPSRAELLENLNALSHNLPELPHDHNGRVLPRVVYAARHIVYRTHQDGSVIEAIIEDKDKHITPDFGQMDHVVGELMNAYHDNAPPYNYPDTLTPQDSRNMPKTPFADDKQKANFFLTSCLWMRRMNSVTAMQYIGRMFDDTRDWERDPFDPHIAATMTEDEVLQLLEPYGQLQMRGFTVPAWINNAQHLVDHFDGDARNIIKDTNSYEEIADRMLNKISRADRIDGATNPRDGFEGFRKKMVSMFLYYMIDSGVKDYFDFPMPVDIHVARFGMGCDLVTFGGFAPDSNHMTPQLLDTLRDMLYDYSVSTGASQIDVCNAIWLLGASACSRSPETQTSKIVSDKRRSILEWYEPDYAPGSNDLKRFIETCGACAVKDYCKRVARGKENQLLGTMTPRVRNRPDLRGDALIPISAVTGSIRRQQSQAQHASIAQPKPQEPQLF